MKQYRPLRLLARFLNGFAWLGMFLGFASLVATLILRLYPGIPLDLRDLAWTGSWMLACLAMYAIAQVVYLLLSINEKLQESL